MRRWIVAALLLLCLPVVGRGQSIRYYPDSTSYTLGKTESGILYRAASANPTLLDGLVSYWTLDEASGTRADSVGSNDLTDNNTVGAKLRGPEGTVANMVYANSEWLSKRIDLDYSLGVTLSIWYKQPIGANAQGRYASHGGWYYYGGPGGFGLSDGNSNPNLYWTVGDTASNVSAAAALPRNFYGEWHHAVCWYDPADKKAKFRLDGGSVNASATGLANHPDPAAGLYKDFLVAREGVVTIYSDQQTGPTGLWNRLLTTDEQDALFAVGNGARYADIDVGASCAGWWEMDEVSGVRYDSHGSNDLTDNNTVSSETAVPGAMNNAAASLVAANSEYLSRAAITELGSPLSLGFWLNPADTARRVLFANGETNVTAGMLMESSVNGAGDINVFLNSALDSYAYTGAGVLTVGAWHHVIFTFDGGIPKMYVNNVEKALTVVGVPASSLPYGNNFYIGAGPVTSRYANGLIDEVAIWDRVLSEAERTKLYNAGAGVYYPTFQ